MLKLPLDILEGAQTSIVLRTKTIIEDSSLLTYVEENRREKYKIRIAGELSSEKEYVHISTLGLK